MQFSRRIVLLGIMLFFNILLLLCGLFVIRLALVQANVVDYSIFEVDPQSFKWFCIFLVFLGILVIAVCILGPVIVFLDNTLGFRSYPALIAVLLLIQILISFLVMPDPMTYKDGFRVRMFEFMRDKKDKALKFSDFQEEYGCCGYLWFQDWRDSGHSYIPGSCCGTKKHCLGWQDAFFTISCGDLLAAVLEAVIHYLPFIFTLMSFSEVLLACCSVWIVFDPELFRNGRKTSAEEFEVSHLREDSGIVFKEPCNSLQMRTNNRNSNSKAVVHPFVPE